MALSGLNAALARPAAEVAAPTSLPLSGTLRGTVQFVTDGSPTGPVGLAFSPMATFGHSTRGAVAGDLAPLGRVRLTSELTWNSPVSVHDMLIVWSSRGPVYLAVQAPPSPPTPQAPTTTLRYQVIPGMSGPRPTLYAPGSGTITLALGHFRPGHRGVQLATGTLTFTPDTVPGPTTS